MGHAGQSAKPAPKGAPGPAATIAPGPAELTAKVSTNTFVTVTAVNATFNGSSVTLHDVAPTVTYISIDPAPTAGQPSQCRPRSRGNGVCASESACACVCLSALTYTYKSLAGRTIVLRVGEAALSEGQHLWDVAKLTRSLTCWPCKRNGGALGRVS